MAKEHGQRYQRNDENDLEKNAVVRQRWPKDQSKGKERAVNIDNMTLVRYINTREKDEMPK